jgi:hypothetical protein
MHVVGLFAVFAALIDTLMRSGGVIAGAFDKIRHEA